MVTWSRTRSGKWPPNEGGILFFFSFPDEEREVASFTANVERGSPPSVNVVVYVVITARTP